ncbi:hypothetical protein FRX31_018057 [Thalictrum thalictroides]|uniref:Uncharacterized protein n=1 Tax=Thalictrum thalictroides TaxID=46969 RepID=A0A7J6W4P5_THATH|nr:hypothetical protein FRX31_018057 [Thalictrum thalictroides]
MECEIVPFCRICCFCWIVRITLLNVLLCVDVDDCFKTLATMQLIGSLFSNIKHIQEYQDLKGCSCGAYAIYIIYNMWTNS